MLNVFFKRDRKYNNIIYINFIKRTKCSKNIIDFSLHVNKRIVIVYNKNKNIKDFLIFI